MSSWPSRLASKQNHIASKLTDNLLELGGAYTDVILIRENLDKFGDKVTVDILSMDVVNIMFPDMKDIPLKRFLGSGVLGIPDTVSADGEGEGNRTFECHAPVRYKIDQGSIIVRFFDHAQGVDANLPTSTQPWILPLQVKDLKGTFGYRSIIHQTLMLSYYDNEIPDRVMEFVMQMATRRGLLGW